MYTIWAVFGGFILHFLLSNFLTVLLKPSREAPVNTAADLVNRGMYLYLSPKQRIYEQIFANSPDKNYQALAKRILIATSRNAYSKNVRRVKGLTKLALMRHQPQPGQGALYHSSEPVQGTYNFIGSIANKKWPLKKVL